MDDLQYLARKKDTRLNLTSKTSPLLEQPEPTLRKRTYLQPGQDAPEGSEEQEGPRGGRYYEEGGQAEQPEPKRRHAYSGAPGRGAEDAKQVERNIAEMIANPAEAEWEDISGTSFVGQLDDFSGQDLVDILGPPHWEPDEGVTSKVQAEWAFKFKDGTVATVYDYKTGKSYVGEEGQSLQETTDWHIGGNSEKASKYIKDMIDAKQQGEVDEAEADTGGKREGYGGNPFLRSAREVVDDLDKFVKARTYLKPGEEAPEGSQAQQGKRGGRYYEPKPRTGGVKPSVGTEPYEWSHGKKPRGTGGWAFQFDDDEEPQFFHGTYADAKKQAIAEGRKRGVNRIKTLP